MADSDHSDPKARLQALEAKLAARRKTEAPVKAHMDDHYSQAQHAWRMVIELVAGLGIGLAIGYGLDMVFGTMPLFLIVFTLLGFAAGIRTVLRTAQEMQKNLPDEPGVNDERD